MLRLRPSLLLVIAVLAIATALLPEQPPPLGIVVLDPGHGGDELGATGDGIIERDSNLDIAQRVRALLGPHNVVVVLTRDSDERPHRATEPTALSGYSATFADLQARVAIANVARADVFLSIHSNA
jgi:N-acetylmuramoyl-L-alanine amidase